MSGLEALRLHAAELSSSSGYAGDRCQEGNRLFAVLHSYRFPEGVARVPTSEILFIGDTQYPLSAMDMFWTDLELVRPDGATFQGSDTIEEYMGRRWRRFSYHRNGIWSPNGNPLMDHFAFMETRWTGKATK